MSHLAIIRSFSNLANSRLSLIVVSSFHNNKRAIPINTMAPITPNIIPEMLNNNKFKELQKLKNTVCSNTY